MIQRKIFFFLFFLIYAVKTIAQGGATIKASVDKNKILIGEPLQLTVEVYLSPESIKLFVVIESIPHFEFLETPLVDTLNKVGGLKLRSIYKLTSFDSGHWVIPPIALSDKIKSDSIPVDVVFSDFNPDQDYHDIKDIIEIEAKAKKSWIWYLVTGVVAVLLLIYFLLKRKKVPVNVVMAPALNPLEEAMKQLEILQNQKSSGKIYHTKLIDIFKLYVLKKKNILSLQKTTDDLVRQLNPILNDKEMYNQLQQALRLSDYVKFAKYVSTAEDDRTTFETILKTIKKIEQSGS